jgi:hypothetical protein
MLRVVYDLKGLGEKPFEDLCRAIAVHVLGPHVQAFGDGPDGGRELSWDGSVGYPGSDPRGHWSGYGVLQAKFRRRNVGVKDLDWLRGQLRAEFAEWTNPAAARVRRGSVPRFLIVATNVGLTSVTGTGGIDQARAMLAEHGKKLGLQGWALWDANQISMYLNAYPAVAQRFSAFITPSDVLAETRKTLQAIKKRQPGNPAARCPSCGSQQMSRRLPALYREQRREVKMRVDGRSYRANSVSALGRQIAPPAMPRIPVHALLVAGFTGFCFVGSARELLQPSGISEAGTTLTALLVSLVGLAVMVPLVIRAIRNRIRVEPEVSLAQWLWQRTWCCRRCDVAWVSTPELPRELWGRSFRMSATTANLRATARPILADRARREGRGPAVPRVPQG